jgi:hypothetical protein
MIELASQNNKHQVLDIIERFQTIGNTSQQLVAFALVFLQWTSLVKPRWSLVEAQVSIYDRYKLFEVTDGLNFRHWT